MIYCQIKSGCPLFLLCLSYITELRVRRTCLLHLLMNYMSMNIFVLVVAFFSLLAVIAYVFGGTK
jgi:hypothetical protein